MCTPQLVTVPSIPDANESISVSSSEKLSVTVEGVVEQKCPTGKCVHLLLVYNALLQF